MSWISGLADKAENILVKIDKNAATALQIPEITTSASVPLFNALLTNSMTNSFSNSTESLKTTLSSHNLKHWTTGSLTNENMGEVSRSKDKLEISDFHPEKTSTRRGSVSSKADSLSINIEQATEDIEPAQIVKNTEETAIASPLQRSLALVSSNQELAAFRIALSEVTAERDELRLRLNALNRDVENRGLKQRVQELEILAKRLSEERDRAQTDLHDVQTASIAYVHSISELETNLAKLQQEYLDVNQKLQMQKKETDFQRQQLQEYRTKAQLALQMKDKLIEEHKSNAAVKSTEDISTDDTKVRLLQLECDALKQEQVNWLDENRNLTQQIEDIRCDWNTYQRQQAEHVENLRAETDKLRKELSLRREQMVTSDAERQMLLQQIQHLQEKQQQLNDKQKMLKKPSVSISVEQQENRIESLTNALVEKQNAVENLTAERNALKIQLEKVKDQLQQTVYSYSAQNQVQRNALLSNSTDDIKAQYPLLLKENPFDNRVARRVKRAYSSLDSAGIRVGAFLRRYPLMRIFVLMYVGLLHIWVMFVLFLSTPNQN